MEQSHVRVVASVERIITLLVSSSMILTVYCWIIPFLSSCTGGSQLKVRLDGLSGWALTSRGGPPGARNKKKKYHQHADSDTATHTYHQ